MAIRTGCTDVLPTALAMVVVALATAGCGGTLDDAVDKVVPQREAQYKSSRSLPPLEIPPDLSSATLQESLAVPTSGAGTGTATLSQYNTTTTRVAATNASVLPTLSEARVIRTGDKRWLMVDAPAGQVWPKVRDFWLNQGFIINLEDASVGIMETDWAEQRDRIEGGIVRGLMEKLSSALYGTATRDKFRTRLERGEDPEATEIYVTHRGAEEVVSEAAQSVPSAENSRVWQPRPADPELEAEMLARMMVFFGTEENEARQRIARTRNRDVERATIQRDGSGAALLTLDEGFSRAWRRTGLALDRVGFTVEDRDRSRGLYFVRYVDPDKDFEGEQEKKGFMSKLAFWKGDEKRDPERDAYLISLVGGRDDEPRTQVLVLDKDGQRDATRTADRILSLLHEQLSTLR